MEGWTDGWMNGWTDEWMNGWTDGWMDGQIQFITKTHCNFNTVSLTSIAVCITVKSTLKGLIVGTVTRSGTFPINRKRSRLRL